MGHYYGHGFGPMMANGDWSWWMIGHMGFRFIIGLLVIALLVSLVRYFWCGRKPGDKCFSNKTDSNTDAPPNTP